MKNKNHEHPQTALINLLPQSQGEALVLRERAKRIAKQVVETIQRTSEDTYVCFRLGAQEHYGLPYHYAKEVLHNLTPTKLPHSPDYIAGVINRRGSLIAVFDLKRLFHIQPAEYGKNTYILVASGKRMTIGILADSIEGSRVYDASTLDAPLASDGIIKADYILGLHQGKTALINIDAILSDFQAQKKGIF